MAMGEVTSKMGEVELGNEGEMANEGSHKECENKKGEEQGNIGAKSQLPLTAQGENKAHVDKSQPLSSHGEHKTPGEVSLPKQKKWKKNCKRE